MEQNGRPESHCGAVDRRQQRFRETDQRTDQLIEVLAEGFVSRVDRCEVDPARKSTTCSLKQYHRNVRGGVSFIQCAGQLAIGPRCECIDPVRTVESHRPGTRPSSRTRISCSVGWASHPSVLPHRSNARPRGPLFPSLAGQPHPSPSFPGTGAGGGRYKLTTLRCGKEALLHKVRVMFCVHPLGPNP